MKMCPGMFALALGVALPATVSANEVYKSTMADGSVVYGESPQAGARKVEKIEARAAATGKINVTDQDRNRAERIRARGGSVAVMPETKRDPAPALEAGTINRPGVMPKRGY